MPIPLVKKFFRQFDMFSSYATFRTKGEPEARNTCAGVLSFIILLLFVYLFISQFTQAANWQNIQSIQTQNYTFDEMRKVQTFMVAVGLQGYRIEGLTEYLRFQMIQVTKNGTKTISNRKLRTQKCTRQHWSQLNNSIQQNFNSFDLQKKLCLSLDERFQIQQPSNDIYKILKIQINACRRLYFSNNSMMYDDCADENMTAYKNNLQIQAYKYFTASVVYLNTAFNPLSQKSTAKFMQSIKLTFTVTQGTQAFVQFLTYQIQTDSSLLPYQQINIENGYANHKTQHNNFQIVKYFQHASCSFSLSSTSILITRNIGKIDEILSYSGGLFGIIISFLSFFMMSFNQYKYELMTAQSAFNYNEDGKKIKQGDLTYFLYLKYQIFDWVKTLICYEIPWEDCIEIDQTRQQAVNQLDITLMFKKLQYFERFIEHIISDKQKIGLFLTQPPSIQKVRIKRLIAQYYDKVIKGRPAVTIQDLNIETGIFEFACDQLKIKSQQNSKNYISQEREDIIHFAILKYNESRMQIEVDDDVEFDENEKKIEEYISQSFFMIEESSRRKIQKKIPIKILKRLLKIKTFQAPSSQYSINLQI